MKRVVVSRKRAFWIGASVILLAAGVSACWIVAAFLWRVAAPVPKETIASVRLVVGATLDCHFSTPRGGARSLDLILSGQPGSEESPVPSADVVSVTWELRRIGGETTSGRESATREYWPEDGGAKIHIVGFASLPDAAYGFHLRIESVDAGLVESRAELQLSGPPYGEYTK